MCTYELGDFVMFINANYNTCPTLCLYPCVNLIVISKYCDYN